MTGQADLYDKSRAVVLAALMVVSVFGGTMAFAGTAAAASGLNAPSGDVQPSDTVSLSVDTASNDVVYGIDSDNSGTIEGDEVVGTSDGSSDATASISFSPDTLPDIDSSTDADFDIAVKEEDGSSNDGSDDLSSFDVTNADATGTLSVDGVAPSITGASVTSSPNSGSTYAQGETVQVTVSYDEAVTVDESGGTPTLDLGTNVGGVASYVSGSGTTDIVFEYTVQSGDEGDLSIGDISLNSGSMKDAAGNDASLTNSESITASVDGNLPSDPSGTTVLTATPIDSDTETSVDIDVEFSNSPESGTVHLKVSDGSASVESDKAANTGGTTTSFSGVDVSGLADGELTATAKIVDDAGNENSNGYTASSTFKKDTTSPTNGGIAAPSSDVYKRPGDTLQVGYYYEDDNPQDLTVELFDSNNVDKTWENIDDSQYTDDGKVRNITLALDSVPDGQYNVRVTATDSADNSETFETSEQPVYVDSVDDPTVDDPSVDADNYAPGDTVTVDYDYSASPTVAADITFELLNDSGVVVATESKEDVSSEGSESYEFTLPSDIEGDYTIDVTAETNHYGDSASAESVPFTVNADAPSIQSVEAQADSDTVVVTFDEAVYANEGGTGDLDATDFAYEDINAGAAGAIESVEHEAGSETVTLTLNNEVSVDDLNEDLVGARTGAVYDYAGATAGTAGVPLQDTVFNGALDSDDVDASVINKVNADTYTVSVDLSNVDERVDLQLTLTGPNDNTTTAQKADVTADSVTFSGLDTSYASGNKLAEGEVSVSVTATDKAQNAANQNSAEATVTKDVTAPKITEVRGGVGSMFVTAELSNADDLSSDIYAHEFTLESTGTQVRSAKLVDETEDDGSARVYVWLDGALEQADFDDGVALKSTLTDDAGNEIVEESPSVTDANPQEIVMAGSVVDSDTVEVYFDGAVYNGSGGNLTAANFTYTNVSDATDAKVLSVDHTAGEAVATLTLNESVTAADFDSESFDTVSIEAEEVYTSDAPDSDSLAAQTHKVEDLDYPEITDFSVETDGSAIDVSLTVDEKLESTYVDLNADSRTDQPDSVSLSLTESADGSYTYNGSVSVADDAYEVDASVADAASNWAFTVERSVVVDTENPHIVDAELTGSSTFEMEVNEPVDNIQVTDLSIEGYSGGIQSVFKLQDSATEYEVVTDGPLATGDAPNVTVELTENAGADGKTTNTTKTTLDTHEFDLKKGVNFVSVPAEYGSLDIASSGFADMTVMTYDDGKWLTYNPDKPDQDFSELEGGQGYIVNASEQTTVDVTVRNAEPGDTAEAASPGQETLEEGWNLVGHWEEDSQSVGDALSTVNTVSMNTYIWTQQTAGEFSYQQAGQNFEPGEAYWVFVEDDEVYTATKQVVN
jgi:surface glycoprotein (TIGR04207 family)